jgi:hypothetical protein
MLAGATLIGYASHLGLARLQNELEDWASDFFVRAPNDPYRTRTEIGSIGRLKQTDAILMRVYARAAQAARIKLLHTASFNTYSGGAWLAREAPLAPLASDADGSTWRLADAAPAASASLVMRAEPGRTLLALPTGTSQISALNAAVLRRNSLGSTLAEIPPGWVRYQAGYVDGAEDEAPPSAHDVAVPPEEAAVLRQVASQLGLYGTDAAEALRRVKTHLDGFSYSLWRERPASGQTAIGDFLLRTRSGHCEYFAAAAALLLRTAGVPARYATGFAAIEHSRLEGAFVVRARHAHAWTRVYVGDRWVNLDATPASWAEEEAALAPVWQGVLDFFRWLSVKWAMREAGSLAPWGWGAGSLGVLILAWRLRRRGQLLKPRAEPGAKPPLRRGTDSELYAIAGLLAGRLGARGSAESFPAWLARVGHGMDAALLEQFRAALALHERYRFDPEGLPGPEREALRSHCRALERSLQAT